jgi:hypothetical protein
MSDYLVKSPSHISLSGLIVHRYPAFCSGENLFSHKGPATVSKCALRIRLRIMHQITHIASKTPNLSSVYVLGLRSALIRLRWPPCQEILSLADSANASNLLPFSQDIALQIGSLLALKRSSSTQVPKCSDAQMLECLSTPSAESGIRLPHASVWTDRPGAC